jgi:DNA ligase (NAD+)
VNSYDDFVTWASGTGATEFFLTHKIDGSSMELVYDGGRLVRCVTRGDGTIGEDVTFNVSQVPTVPKTVNVAGRLTVRGEVVMFKSTFQESYSKEYANPRNTAAAKVREKKHGGIHCRDLMFLAYWMSDHPERPDTVHDMIGWLEKAGFKTPIRHEPGNVDQIREKFSLESLGRVSLPYEIDGMVVSVNDMKKLGSLGDHNMRPRGQIAWKFNAEMRETRVTGVVWQVGPTGRICPVAKVDPVNIGGVSITSVSLHNLSMFRELGLWPGCRVLVSRRNDVIPYVEQNLDRD